MAVELIDHHFEVPNFIDELLNDYSFESDSSLQTSDLFTSSPNTIVDDHSNPDQEGLHKLQQIEAQLMDIETSQENIHSLTQENVHSLNKEIGWLQESTLTELLFSAAEAVEANTLSFASNIIEKLNSLLHCSENRHNSFHKLAMFFSQALHHKTCINNSPPQVEFPSLYRSTNTMSSFQMLQELSPNVKFAHFTANQAILEATQENESIHVIDLEIMEGSQWPSLMVDLARRKGRPCASLRVTVITVYQQSANLARQTGRRLKEFSKTINLLFVFDQMMVVAEEDFPRIDLYDDSAVVANCMIHQLHLPDRSISLVKTFLSGMSKLSPKLIVLVQEELFNFSKMPPMFFVEFFSNALHHYNALCDSLVSSFSSEYKTGLRQIEKEVLGVKILECVRRFPSVKEERMLWEDCLASLKGFKSMPLSSCDVSQAKYLVSLFHKGFWVQHEKGRLSLCWKSTPLTSASIWVPSTIHLCV